MIYGFLKPWKPVFISSIVGFLVCSSLIRTRLRMTPWQIGEGGLSDSIVADAGDAFGGRYVWRAVHCFLAHALWRWVEHVSDCLVASSWAPRHLCCLLRLGYVQTRRHLRRFFRAELHNDNFRHRFWMASLSRTSRSPSRTSRVASMTFCEGGLA